MPADTTPDPVEDLARLASTLAREARQADQRRALVLTGTAEWGGWCARLILDTVGVETPLWLDGSADSSRNARQWLGREMDALVIDAHGGLDPESLGAAGGSLTAGGLLLLLTPPLADWPHRPDPQLSRITVHPWRPEQLPNRFIRRLAHVLGGSTDAISIEQDRPLPTLPEASAHPFPTRRARRPASPWRTEDQRQAIQGVLRVAQGHRHRPLVVASDRGRGKSAAFGIAAAQLLKDGCSPILVTGPRLDALRSLFQHAATLLPDAEVTRDCIRWQDRLIRFHAPDALARERPVARLVLVDEAAALPLPLLEQLLCGYARIAFATTVHGYEGSGRGFSLKFPETLDRHAPSWHLLKLRQPIRWAEGDPVERLIGRALLLDADVAPSELPGDATPSECRVERFDRDALIADDTALSELFGLLILAHYRTRPLDLRQLLDGPNVSVLALRHQDRLLGVALLAREGNLAPELAEEVWSGRRRVRGHLIPQSLAAHLGLQAGAQLRGERVMRIAVHPAVQGRGLGTRLIKAIEQEARRLGADWLGASFGATPELLRFWRRAAMHPLRAGITHEASSGAQSVLALKGLSQPGQALYESARRRFLSQLPHQLSGPLAELDPPTAAELMGREEQYRGCVDLEPQDWLDLVAFVFAGRSYEDSHPAVWKLTCLALMSPRVDKLLTREQAALVTATVLMKHSWGRLAQTFEFSGRRACLNALRQALEPLIEAHAPPPVLVLRTRLSQSH